MDISLFSKYRAELEVELDLTDFNMKDVQMGLPGVKHKWVARLIDIKIELNKLKGLKAEAISTIIEKNKGENKVAMSDAALARQAGNHEAVKKINNKINESEIIIEYLEKVERICNSTTYDIKNLVDIKKLELT
jgi:hypothetical protein